MKLSNWVAVIGCVGLGIGAVVGAQGCTASLVVGSCDGSCVPLNEDSGVSPTEDSGSISTDSGVTTDSSTTTTTDGGDATAPVNACNSCLYGQCVGQYANCVADQSATGCLTIYQCATSAACMADGGNCVQDCYNAGSATAKALYLALGDCDQNAQCVGTSPTGTCATTCSSTAASCPAPAADDAGEDAAVDAAVADAGTCSGCQASSCSTQLAACATGTACAQYNQCLLACTSSTCDTGCTTMYSAGASAAAALGSCTATNCSTQCQ